VSDSTGNPSTPSGTTPPGWHADPAGSPQLRWWDGTQWTEHLQWPQAGAQAASGYPSAPAYAFTPQPIATVPAGAPVYGPLIWAVTLLPLLNLLLLPLAFTEFDRMMAGTTDPYSVSPYSGYSTAGLLAQGISSLLTWAIAAAIIVLSFFDHRWLRRHGVERPFHWAWSFFALLGAPVYAIGRSVIVRRRSGRGIAPMWVAIAIIVLSVIISIVVVVVIFQTAFSAAMLSGSYT